MDKTLSKKSWGLFYVWILGLVVLLTLLGIIINRVFPNVSPATHMKILVIFFSLYLVILFYIIYKTERVYWINGTSYEDAFRATSEQRKKFAMKHLSKFIKAFIIICLYCVISTIFGSAYGIDIFVCTVILCIAAISTIPAKL